MNTNALLYVRVSSKEQEKEGFSLDAQEKLGIDYAKRKQLNIIKTWKVSESAWRKDRIYFNQLVDYAKKHTKITRIIFDVLDRMTRNDFDKLKMYTLIKDHDKTIHFSRSNKIIHKDSGSEDEFMLDIEVAVAKKMSNDISRKCRMGMKEKAEQGFYPSIAPLGYHNNKLTRLIEADQEKTPYVQKIFSLMSTGSYSLGMLVDKIHSEGLRGKKGNKVGKSAVDKLLKNPIYYGAFRWKGKLYQGSHTPLISKALFDSVQNVLGGGCSRPSKQRKGFAFNNLLICGGCGCKVLGETKKKKYNYYHCTKSKGKHENLMYLREEKLADIFGDTVKKITLTDDIVKWFKKLLKEGSQNTAQFQQNRLCALQKEYDRINHRLNKLYDLRLDNEIPEERFKLKENELNEKLFEVKEQMKQAETVNPNIYDKGCEILELSKSFYPQYVRTNYDGKAKILKSIASNYRLNGVSVTPTYRKPFDILAKGLNRTDWRARHDSNVQHPLP